MKGPGLAVEKRRNIAGRGRRFKQHNDRLVGSLQVLEAAANIVRVLGVLVPDTDAKGRRRKVKVGNGRHQVAAGVVIRGGRDNRLAFGQVLFRRVQQQVVGAVLLRNGRRRRDFDVGWEHGSGDEYIETEQEYW